jgi:hypothetical protein
VWLDSGDLGDGVNVDRDYRNQPILTVRPPAADAAAMAAILRGHAVSAVYHWTPMRSVDSILERGILSRAALHERGIAYVAHGYGSFAKEQALRDFACVSLETKPWMMQTWSESPVVIELHTDVLYGIGTLFIPGNSASSLWDVAQLAALTGQAALASLFHAGRPVSQAEAWIPRLIPRVAIRSLHVPDEALVGRLPGSVREASIPIRVTPELFAPGVLQRISDPGGGPGIPADSG